VWTEIWAPPTAQQAANHVYLALDEQGIYHATWTETDEILDWNPTGIWYARSTDGGVTWTDFKNIRDNGSYASVGFDSGGNVHMLWNHNVSSIDGRYHAWSQDGGKNWTEPEWIFPGLSGRTGFPRMILDSDGVLHQVTSGYGLIGSNNIYYSRWLGDHWSELVRISEGIEHSELPEVAMVGGNHLFAVWCSWDINDVVYAAYQTGAAQVPLSAEPDPTLPDSITNVKETPEPALLEEESQEVVMFDPELLAQVEDNYQDSPLLPVALGILPSLIIVAGVMIWRFRRR
jgi:hypothetical protein